MHPLAYWILLPLAIVGWTAIVLRIFNAADPQETP